MQKIVIITLFLLFTVTTSAQKIFNGKVFDAITGKPVPSASVFLSNTSRGTVTDNLGTFAIYNFPEGRFDVIVSCLGYKTYTQTIESNNIPASFIVNLQVKVDELTEVVIGASEELSWRDWGQFFLDNFIGTSEFSEHCRLRNTEVIKLRRNKKTRVITAYADKPLIIENKELGYIIHYQLEQFEYDSRTRYLFFAGYPLFETMKSNRQKIIMRWEKNRQEAYYGSMMHFMRTVYRNKLAEEQFEVRRLVKKPNYEKLRVKEAYKKYLSKKINTENNKIINHSPTLIDSSAYYDRILSQPDENSYLDTRLLNGDSIAYATDSVTLIVSFKDYLYVIYKNKKEPERYLFQTREQRPPSNISSEIRLNENEIQVFYNGSFFPGTAIVNAGFWGWWEKIGTMLPFDYWPK